jgi:hypothetical protein
MSASRFIEIEGALFLATGGAPSPGVAEGTCASAAACPFSPQRGLPAGEPTLFSQYLSRRQPSFRRAFARE